MSNERFDDEMLSAIIDGEADDATVASVLADDAASQRLEDMRTAVEVVAEEPPPATPQRRQQSIAAALAAAKSAPEVTSLTAERQARRPSFNPKALAIAAALLLFVVVAIPVIAGLRPGAENLADTAEDSASTELAAGDAADAVADVVDGDDEDEAMEDEEDEATAATVPAPPAEETDAAASDEDDDAELDFVESELTLAERLATETDPVPASNSIDGINELIRFGSITPQYTIDDLVEADVNPACVNGDTNVQRFGAAFLESFAGPDELIIIEFTDNMTIVLDAEDCSVLGYAGRMSTARDDTPDWPRQATETIVDFVDNVKHKTTEPATKVVRGVVYGIAIALLGVPALIMLLVGIVHGLNQVATGLLGLGVWLVYLVLGVIFSIVGAVLWRKRVA